MAQQKIEFTQTQGNLLLAVPDVTLAEILREVAELCRRHPEILSRIEADQICPGLAKKQIRLDQKSWLAAQTPALSGLEEHVNGRATAVHLGQGRPRMAPEAALTFLVITEYFGSVYSKTAVERLWDSMTVYWFLGNRGVRMPGVRTIGDNVNAVSAETRRFIMQCHLQDVLTEELDDFENLIGDSTAVSANSRWPTDSGLIYRLLLRAFRVSQTLETFGLENFRVHWMNQWLPKLKALDYQICTAKRKRTRNRRYRSFLGVASKAAVHLIEEAERLHFRYQTTSTSPMMRRRLSLRWNRVVDDLCAVCRVYGHCETRLHGGKLPSSSERVLSLSDQSAGYITKGGRTPVLGYRPQLARSTNGYVTALLVEEGNVSDAKMLVPLVEEAEELTGVLPHTVSFDDGYSSGPGYKALVDKKINVVSLSGAKGKKILGDEVWEQDVYREARRFRSTVESLIFCLKYCHHFGELRRRGIEAVRQELLGKSIVYNFCRTIMLRKRAAAEGVPDKARRAA